MRAFALVCLCACEVCALVLLCACALLRLCACAFVRCVWCVCVIWILAFLADEGGVRENDCRAEGEYCEVEEGGCDMTLL